MDSVSSGFSSVPPPSTSGRKRKIAPAEEAPSAKKPASFTNELTKIADLSAEDFMHHATSEWFGRHVVPAPAPGAKSLANLPGLMHSLLSSAKKGELPAPETKEAHTLQRQLQVIKTRLSDAGFKDQQAYRDLKEINRHLEGSKDAVMTEIPAPVQQLLNVDQNIVQEWWNGDPAHIKLSFGPSGPRLEFSDSLREKVTDKDLENIFKYSDKEKLGMVSEFDVKSCPKLSKQAPALLAAYCPNLHPKCFTFIKEKKELLDHTLIVGRTSIKINKAFVAAKSPFFKEMWTSPMKEGGGDAETTLREASPHAVRDCMNALTGLYLIDDETDVNRLANLLQQASFFRMNKIADWCGVRILDLMEPSMNLDMLIDIHAKFSPYLAQMPSTEADLTGVGEEIFNSTPIEKLLSLVENKDFVRDMASSLGPPLIDNYAHKMTENPKLVLKRPAWQEFSTLYTALAPYADNIRNFKRLFESLIWNYFDKKKELGKDYERDPAIFLQIHSEICQRLFYERVTLNSSAVKIILKMTDQDPQFNALSAAERLQFYEQLFELAPQDPTLLTRASKPVASIGDFVKAKTMLESAVAQDAKNSEARALLLHLCIHTPAPPGYLPEARDLLQKEIDNPPTHFSAYLTMAHLLLTSTPPDPAAVLRLLDTFDFQNNDQKELAAEERVGDELGVRMIQGYLAFLLMGGIGGIAQDQDRARRLYNKSDMEYESRNQPLFYAMKDYFVSTEADAQANFEEYRDEMLSEFYDKVLCQMEFWQKPLVEQIIQSMPDYLRDAIRAFTPPPKE